MSKTPCKIGVGSTMETKVWDHTAGLTAVSMASISCITILLKHRCHQYHLQPDSTRKSDRQSSSAKYFVDQASAEDFQKGTYCSQHIADMLLAKQENMEREN